MLAVQYSQTIFILVLTLHGVLGAVIMESDSAPKPKTAKKSLPVEKPHTVQRRQVQVVDTINVCFDCDLVCINAIATTSYKLPFAYFTAVITQLNTIYANSQLPLAANLQGITTVKKDLILDPYNNFTTLDQAMDLYWEGARIAQRQSQGCHVSLLVTDDPIFNKPDMPAGMGYVNSLCTEWGYGISRYTADISAQTARVAHEISHTMNINHVGDGDLAYTNYFEVIANCYPDYCPDPTGQCITQATLTAPAPTYYSYCGRATFFAWRLSGGGQPCLASIESYYNFELGSGSA